MKHIIVLFLIFHSILLYADEKNERFLNKKNTAIENEISLTHGPRIGYPSPNGFKVWLKTDGYASATLETREFGSKVWIIQERKNVETEKYNTVVLEATGLNEATKYEYRRATSKYFLIHYD